MINMRRTSINTAIITAEPVQRGVIICNQRRKETTLTILFGGLAEPVQPSPRTAKPGIRVVQISIQLFK